MAILFRRTKELEGMIDQFLDHVVEGSLLFRQGVLYYLDDDLEALERCMHELGLLENAGDALRRDVETRMYSETLIPEARGDVLGLLETIDEVKLRLEGKEQEIAELDPDSVSVEVRLMEGELGVVDITRERMNVIMPGDFEVISIEPDGFPL